MKKRKLVLFMSLALMFLIVNVSATGNVASDDFESNTWNGGEGWNGAWYHEGESKLVSDGEPYAGTRHLRLRKNNGYVERSFNTLQYNDSKLTFWAKVNSFEANDFADLVVSPDGLNWYVLKRFTPTDSDNVYHYYEFDLSQYGLSSNFYIAIDSEMSATNDYLYFDDLKIVSQFVQPPNLPGIKSWHIQFNPAPVAPAADVMYWNLDLFDVPIGTIQNLSDSGVYVICYFSGGSFEDWRADAEEFPEEVLGNGNGWPGERWVDIRSPIVRDIMKARMDLGISKGCDGFDPDNMDAYGNGNTGFPLTEQDAIDYYNFLADYAHSQGKGIGLKNALTIIDDVLGNMDWSINEQCFRFNECNYLQQVLNAGKPVFNIEYGGQSKANSVCPQANEMGMSTIIKKTSLNAFEISCQNY